MKTYLIAFFLCLIASPICAQTLKTEILNLSPGGVIHDVEYDAYKNAYIVVGDFTSIDGQPRFNLAFIDATTFTVTAENPITSINGAIRSIERFHKPQIFPQLTTNFLYLGGDFTMINGTPISYLARLVGSEPIIPPFSFTYSLNSWNPELYGFAGTYDLTLKGDTLLAVGSIEIYTGLTSYATVDCGGVLAYNAGTTTAALGYIPIFQPYGATFPVNLYTVDYLGDEIFVNGYKKFDQNGTLIGNMVSCGPSDSWDFDVHKTDSDTLLIGWKNYSGGNDGIVIQDAEGTMLNCPFNNLISPILIQGGGGLASGFIETYSDNVYLAANNRLDVFKRNGTQPVTPNNSIPINNSWYTFQAGWQPQKHKVVRDKLFISGDQLTTIDGAPRNGLAVFCLQPLNPKNFTAFDTTICDGNEVVYTIPQVQYAEGYQWMYSGSNASYRLAGSLLPFQPLSSAILNGVTTNSIEIQFGSGATGGVLSVVPYSTCNTAVDYLFADTITINLTTAPLPDLSLSSNSMAFNCFIDSFYVVAQSATPNVTWEWEYNSFVVGTDDSIYLHVNDGIIDSSYHYGSVIEPVNGCRSTDSVLIYYDLTPPTVTQNDIISIPPVFDCNTSSLSLGVALPNTTVEWDLIANAAVPSMNNFEIFNADDSTNVYAYVTSTINGCLAQQQYAVSIDQATLGGDLLGYSNFGFALVNDTLNCTTSTLDLQCDILSGNGNAQWVIGGIPSGDLLSLTVADSSGMNAFETNTYQFETTNNDNGCVESFDVTIQFDFDIPFVNSYSGPSSLNCSALDLELIHNQSGGNTIEGWLNQFGVQTNSDSLLITTIGDYYYQVQSTENGCLAIDTATIIQTSELLLDLASDTLICPNQIISVTVSPINNVETTTYIWSNGATLQSINATGGVDTFLSVIAENTSGCLGYDTIEVVITPPVQADVIASSGCTDGALQVSNVSGGSGNYQYSMNQVDWQVNPAFGGLSFGAHTVYIQDDLSCVYSFIESIDANAGGLDVNFLVSTYNSEGDTLAIVNISDFTGFDSIAWVVPPNASIYSIADSMVVLSILNGGWYDVTLIAYQDTCGFSFKKSVYFGTESPLFEDDYNATGIQTVSIYPNPTTGNFMVDVAFEIAQNYTIIVTNMQGQPLLGMSNSGVGQIVSESFNFPQGSPSGSYVIHIVADYDAKQQTIILN